MQFDPYKLSQNIRETATAREQLATMQQQRKFQAQSEPVRQQTSQAQLLAMQNANAAEPVRQETAQAQLAKIKNANTDADTKRKMQASSLLSSTIGRMEANPEQAPLVYQNALQTAKASGMDVSSFPQEYDPNTIADLKDFNAQLNQDNMSAEYRSFEAKIAALPEEYREEARLIDVGSLGRKVNNATSSALKEGTIQEYAGAEATVAGAKEQAKLEKKFELEPSIAAAVTKATLDVTTAAEAAGKEKTNEQSFNVYETGIRSLAEAMGEANTGPIVGLFPALTTNQQKADGTVAAMAPILKKMFREDGEGPFTDKDQELLMKMIPTRTDTSEARAFKLKNIDNIIRAKLLYKGSVNQRDVPVGALQDLMNNPETIDAFEQHFGYRPEGF
jgi:hypothetical protein